MHSILIYLGYCNVAIFEPLKAEKCPIGETTTFQFYAFVGSIIVILVAVMNNRSTFIHLLQGLRYRKQGYFECAITLPAFSDTPQ